MNATNRTNEATHHVTGAAFFNTDVVDELEGRSPWYAFADADTGYPVYFNQKTEERTWKKPNESFQFMDGTMPSGLSIDPEMLGEDFMDHPFMEPSEEHAIAQATRQVFQQGAHPLCKPVNFSSLGIGVQGYFLMLQFLILMFFLLSLLVFPLIVTYSSGNRLGTLSSSFGLGKYSLGNIQFVDESSQVRGRNSVPMAWVWGEKVPLVPNAAEYISWTIFVAAIVFAAGWTIFSLIIQRMSVVEDSTSCDMRDYTVIVWNLPADACESEIAVHFSNLYNLQHEDWCGRAPPVAHNGRNHELQHKEAEQKKKREKDEKDKKGNIMNKKISGSLGYQYRRGSVIGQIGARSSKLGGGGGGGGGKGEVQGEVKGEKGGEIKTLPNPLYYPTSHFNNVKSNMYQGLWISDLSVGHPNGTLIRSYSEHSDLLQQLRIQRALYKTYRNVNQGNDGNDGRGSTDLSFKQLVYVFKKIKMLEKELLYISMSHKKTNLRRDPEDVVNAYVTFNNQESFRRCYEDHANTRRQCCWWRSTPTPLLFNGEHVLKVDRAPDPSDILWENLEADDASIRKKQCLTCGVTFGLLLSCFVTVFTAFFYANEFSSLINNELVCHAMLPSIHYDMSNITLSKNHSFHSLSSPSLARETYASGQNQQRDLDCRNVDAEHYRKSKSTSASLYYDIRFLSNWTVQAKKNAGGEDDSDMMLEPPSYNVSVCKNDWCNTAARSDSGGDGGDGGDNSNNDQQQRCPCVEVSEDLSKSTSTRSCEFHNKSSGLTTQWNGRDVQNCFCSRDLSRWLKKGGSLTAYILKESYASEGGRAAPLMTSSGSARGPSRQNGAEGAEGAEGEEGEKGEEGEEGQESSASFCARFGYLFALSRGLMIASVSMVSLLNVLLESIVKVVTTWEHNHTLSAQSAAIMSKVFIGMYINTAFILTAVNQKIPGLESVSKGQHNGFTHAWYGTIGASLTLSMLLDIFVPHLMPMVVLFVVKPFVRFLTKRASPIFTTPIVTQKQLNDLHSSVEFELPIRVAYVLNTVSIAITFISGMPLMICFATISLCFSYLVDRFMLLRFYDKGVVYDDTILKRTWQLIPVSQSAG